MNRLHLIWVMEWTVETVLAIPLQCLPNPALLPLYPVLSVLPQAESKGVPPGLLIGSSGLPGALHCKKTVTLATLTQSKTCLRMWTNLFPLLNLCLINVCILLLCLSAALLDWIML